MRRKIKMDIKNIIQTMLEAHEHVLLLLQNKHIVQAEDLLSQCQECAIHIGETIEEKVDMDTQIVSCLETYCELLYKMSKCSDQKKITALKRKLDEILDCVECEIESLPIGKLKVVFMPYKVSMWDCMESIWEAAEADEECEAYVVPIPYYEKDQQGNILKTCYEGDIFPGYVRITHYKEFLLEKEYPDIIYVHNPYDGANYVTSVHPDFYSSNLKEYTDNLVYIPYYILGNGPMDEAHCSLPVYKYMDKIVVQDEDKAKSLSDYVPKEKIVVIGSPKVDRLLKLNNKKKEIIEHDIPLEWRKKINGKKVILFNVSISGILKNSKYSLDKIRYVLRKFQNLKKVVLLWRPHPLLEATLLSMRPEMYDEYISLKNTFIRQEKGIFDETGDVGIAAVVADAYLGENSSSLVHYFGILGKPVLYMDWKITEDKLPDRSILHFNTFCIEKNNLFFVSVDRGRAHNLYKMDLENGNMEAVASLPGISDNVESCYMGIKKVNDKIILIPHNTEDIYVYDVVKKQAIKVVLSDSEDGWMLFHEAVEYKGKVFLIPKRYPALVSIDMQGQEIHEFRECIKTFLMEDKNRWLFSWAYLKREQYLYLASCNDSRILIFNMEDMSFEAKKIGTYSYGYSHMIYDGEYFWLAAYGVNCIVRWDEKLENTREYTYPMEQAYEAENIWSLLVDNKDEIIVCPGFSVEMMFINKETGECRQYKKIKKYMAKSGIGTVDKWEGFISVGFVNEQEIVLIIWKNSSVNIWNTHTNQWRSYTCRLSKNEILDLERRQIEKYWICKAAPYSLHESIVTIPQFVEYILAGKVDVFKHSYDCYQGTEDGPTIGALIHEYMKG